MTVLFNGAHKNFTGNVTNALIKNGNAMFSKLISIVQI